MRLPLLGRHLHLYREHERGQHDEEDDVAAEERMRPEPARPDRGGWTVAVGGAPQPRVVVDAWIAAKIQSVSC